ncbi:polysaccharide biosynthesis protein [Clostridium sp. AF19-22AC]|jgi:FlaA1/EpsC-like NDP-sugar epimerase|uniref:FlaA1/EpsC-like NDP-sugar epimerase n=2 Tax=Bacillota TaxID=1239 RepID=A0A2Y9BC67_9FIRM|nr:MULTISPECIES: nucleoside-diphosphate sugar epimerase/dehydratase [Clostridia]PWJ32003.1 FlaA1/EpsC-like NDP-sugar epimerase [Faecalicatena orotica]RHR31853.1 polysaccharide biosynthesis protein [Clostridium sp. AF19-22AC]SSA53831.1 NDP-sugar epimerase, includes UDP-GlcNAc-inverting 4,6-dehydratase FlaA1 and capsular polysaccharide biosynthesis protein EpsC [Faecalicatena orotica]
MMKLLRKWDLSVIYKVFLVLLDILFINVSSFLALWVRFNMHITEIPGEYYTSVLEVAVVNTIVTVIIFAMFRLYTSLWRFASIKELVYIIEACMVSVLFNLLAYFLTYRMIYRSYFLLYGTALFLLTCVSRFSYRLMRLLYRGNIHGRHVRNTMIIGAGEACNVVMKELELSTELDAKICCVIDDNPRKQGTFIHGVKVVGGRDVILKYADKYDINEIIIAIPSADKRERQKILDICQKIPACDLKILPGVYQLVNGEVTVSKLRNVEIEDLLGRDPIQITTEKIGRYVSDKVVLVTGGGGSIGSELCRQIAANGVKQLIIFDIYENNAYDIQQELKSKYPNLDLVVLIGSVRNGRKVNSVFEKYRPDIVYHAAAHKHVPLMEDSPNEAIKNNVFGTYKVALASDRYGVEKFVLISTDKAVNPTNIMGASKRMCEMIIQVFNSRSKTEFVAVRFGNVLGSNGSVIPLFKKQIEAGGPVTVTHPDIIRYFMTIPEAVSLVLQAGASAKGGEIFVLDMGQPVKIVDLAKNLIRLSGYTLGTDIEIKYTGLRPGEKLYEELLMAEEGLESTENEKIHIGKPIDFDEEEFLRDLEDLYREAYAETDQMKRIVHKIVPTYHLREADIIRDQQIQAGWKKEFTDTRSKLPSAFLSRSAADSDVQPEETETGN